MLKGLLNKLQHLFTPHHTNNHRPRILHPAGLSVLLAIYLLANSAIKLVSAIDNDTVRGTVLGYASSISVDEVVRLTNEERAKQGLSTLSFNPVLAQAAQAKAGDMFAFDYWAHNNPQTGKQPWDFIRSAGYVYRFAGENLARDFGDTTSVMAAWMASPTHRDNIVSDRYTEIGVAVVDGSLQNLETTLVVQMFGQPATKQAVSSLNTLPPIPVLPQPEIAGTTQVTTPNRLPPLSLTKALSLSILLLLLITLVLDYYLIRHRRTIRIAAKNLAHLSFFSAIILVILAARAGGIL